MTTDSQSNKLRRLRRASCRLALILYSFWFVFIHKDDEDVWCRLFATGFMRVGTECTSFLSPFRKRLTLQMNSTTACCSLPAFVDTAHGLGRRVNNLLTYHTVSKTDVD